jgi:ABC-type glycerol-3-phosphate transport system permease component
MKKPAAPVAAAEPATPAAPATAAQPAARAASDVLARTAIYAVLVVGALVTLFPYLLVVLTAFKDRSELFATQPWLPAVPPSPDSLDRLAQSGFFRFVGNTALMTAVLTVGQLVFTTFAAYAFARLRFKGREFLFWCYLATMMVPNVVTMIPLFLIMRQMHVVNTWAGLVAPYILGSSSAPFPPSSRTPPVSTAPGRSPSSGGCCCRSPVPHSARWPSSPSCRAGTTSSGR